MRLTYSQRLLVALLNIDKYNNIVNNTKEYKLIQRMCICFDFLRFVYPMLPVSLDCPFLIATFSNVYFLYLCESLELLYCCFCFVLFLTLSELSSCGQNSNMYQCCFKLLDTTL